MTILSKILYLSFIFFIILSLSIEWKVISNAIPFGDKRFSNSYTNFSKSSSSLFVAILKAWKTWAIFFCLSFWKAPTTASLS